MPGWLRAVVPAPIVLALAFGCLFVGGRSCATSAAPQFVRVLEVVPREVEVGDRVAILGDGFPAGKPARVTFGGTLHRPGERALRGAEIVALATVVTPNRVELTFDDATQALFCGAGDAAMHTTFEGNVEVAFAAAAPGAEPIAGGLEHVTIDVRPIASASLRGRELEGERALAWLGVQAVEGVSGLVVEAVQPGSRARSAGIAAGDVVTSFDGLRVVSPADMVPSPGERAATIGVRSPRESEHVALVKKGASAATVETTHVVSLEGFRSAAPAELVAPSLVVLTSLVVVWLFGAPARPGIASAFQRIVSRMRQRFGVSGLVPVLSAVLRESLPPCGAAAIVDLAACTLLVVMPFGQFVVASRLDVGLLFVAAATCVAAAAFASCRSAWGGMSVAVHIAWQHAPAALAVASVVVATGSMRIQEIERAQGGWPWDWLAFRSPAGLAALGLLMACGCIDPDDTSLNTGHAAAGAAPLTSTSLQRRLAALLDDAHREARERRRLWLEAACRAHRVVVAGLASALFLGGWLLPGLSAPEQGARPALELAGAAWFLVKTACLLLMMTWTRLALPRWRMAQCTRATALWMGPLAMAVLALTTAWTWCSPAPAAQLLVSASLVAAAALAGVAATLRLRHGLLSAVGDVHLSPFL
jgi:NADH-quinone oxidoreductase subunit H